MSNQRTTFAKRQREQNKKDKLKAKQERLAARRAAPRDQKGPPIGPATSFDGQPDASGDMSYTGEVPPEAPSDDLPSSD